VAWGINAVDRTVADPEVLRDMVRTAMSVWDMTGPVQFNSPRMNERLRYDDAHGSTGKKVAVRRGVPHWTEGRYITFLLRKIVKRMHHPVCGLVRVSGQIW
jgi:hypothetical protein